MLDWRGLPLRLAATLAAGLPTESRCKHRAAGLTFPVETLLLAKLADMLELLLWSRARAAGSTQEAPDGVLPLLVGKDTGEKTDACRGFESAEAFERAWRGG